MAGGALLVGRRGRGVEFTGEAGLEKAGREATVLPGREDVARPFERVVVREDEWDHHFDQPSRAAALPGRIASWAAR